MSKTISFRLSKSSMQKAINEIREYQADLKRKFLVFNEKIARIGLSSIRNTLASVPHEVIGNYETGMSEPIIGDDGNLVGLSIYLKGSRVLFVEFSAGITYGTSHYPLPSGAPYGVGTYPDQKHAFDTNGWWYEDEYGEKHHSYGNRAYMPMYHATESIILELRSIAREVFGG